MTLTSLNRGKYRIVAIWYTRELCILFNEIKLDEEEMGKLPKQLREILQSNP